MLTDSFYGTGVKLIDGGIRSVDAFVVAFYENIVVAGTVKSIVESVLSSSTLRVVVGSSLEGSEQVLRDAAGSTDGASEGLRLRERRT